MKNVALLASVCSVLAVLAGCSSSDSDAKTGDNIAEAKSALTRDTAPSLTDEELTTLANGQADFAVDLYQKTAGANAGASVMLSPHSASIALGMAYAGARGTTASAMRTALHLGLPDERVHTGFDYLDLQLASRGQGATGQDGKPFRLNVANGFFGQIGKEFQSAFLDTLAVSYGAGMNLVDYKGDPEGSRNQINGWVENKTEDRIKDLLPAGSITPDTRLVLVNAVYFNASWQSKFEAHATTDASFTKLDGSTANVKMMHQTGGFPYAKGTGYEAIALPYDGGELSMVIIVPDAGTFATFEAGLTGKQLLDIAGSLKPEEVALGYPKHHFEGKFDLRPSLEAMGMKSAFEGGADFSGIDGGTDLQIGGVRQNTFVDVDEEGTEAAAATEVDFALKSAAPVDNKVLDVDRPFLEAIYDTKTKSIVFLGRIVEPKTN